jgi:RNA polymerase sigma-70 factor (ECF subfamily)
MGSPSANYFDEDAALMQRWGRGDRVAGQQLISRHEPELRRFFRAQQPSDADDLTQETLLAIMEARDRFRGEASFRTYLLRIARYKLWSHRRRRQGLHVVWEDAEDALLFDEKGDDCAASDDGLQEALKRLPPMLSRVIVLSFEKKLSRDVIASELGIPPGTVASRLRTAKTRLKALLLAGNG